MIDFYINLFNTNVLTGRRLDFRRCFSWLLCKRHFFLLSFLDVCTVRKPSEEEFVKNIDNKKRDLQGFCPSTLFVPEDYLHFSRCAISRCLKKKGKRTRGKTFSGLSRDYRDSRGQYLYNIVRF